jgi:hypothetical protein
MDASALLHMNEDHTDALLDYARYYGDADFAASGAQLTPNTKSTCMEISYTSGIDSSVRLTRVPLLQPGAGGLRPRLIAMAQEASLARIPALQLPRLAVAVPLLASLAILGIITFVPSDTLREWPATEVWKAATDALAAVGGKNVGMCLFCGALVAHLCEGAYALHILKGVQKPGGRGNRRIAAWVVQTTLVGFPSLTLLVDVLAAAEARQRKHE